MDAKDLASQVVAYSRPSDRPSRLVLVVFSRLRRGSDVRNENVTMRITAPVEDGRLALRVAFPASNCDLAAIRAAAAAAPAEAPATERAVLEYDGNDNLKGAAACVEGYMSSVDANDIVLFRFLDDGSELELRPLATWSLSFEEGRGNRIASRIQIIQQILRSLLVR